MCGRYNVIDDPFMQGLMQMLEIDASLPTQLNIAPTESIPVVWRDHSGNRLSYMRWWLVPAWAKTVDTRYAMFNARSENLKKSRVFSKPFRKQRAIVPASSFIEWQQVDAGKQAMLIEREQAALALAAIYEVTVIDGQALQSCAIVTRAAVPEMEALHSRMPVLLQPSQFKLWLDADTEIELDFQAFTAGLSEPLRATPISSQVNDSRNKSADVIQAVAEPETLH